MKDTVGLLLVGALGLSALLALWVSVLHLQYVRELQDLVAQQVAINNLRNAAQSLANEAIDYSRRNPAIDSVLFQFDLKSRPGASTNQPAAKTP